MKIFNNIFLSQSGSCVTDNGSGIPYLIIDYNDTYNFGSEFNVSPSFIGTNNLSSQDPKLTNPVAGDFTLRLGSPCIATGIGNDSDPSVPIVDYDEATRSLATPDIGAYVFAGVPMVSTPTISPNGGSFSGPVTVTLSCSTSGATIYYTTDGSAPTPFSNLYFAPFVISPPLTIRAKAFKTSYSDSAIAQASFSVHSGIFYADIDNSYNGGGGCCCGCCGGGGHAHKGTPTDPFNWKELNHHSETHPAGQTYFIKGIRTIDSVVDVIVYISHNIWEGWDPATNGPWRIGNIGSGNIVASSDTDSMTRDAIFYASHNIHSFLRADDVLFIASQMVVYDSAVFKGCSFFTGTNFQLSSTSSTITDSLIGVIIGSGNSTFNNCSYISAVDLGTFNNCQSGWLQPSAPLWYGSREGFNTSVLAIDTTAPAQPGNPPYTDYAVGFWDSSRIGIGAVDFTPLPVVATPTITPNGGFFSTSISVTLGCSTSGAAIHYTTDGTDPNILSTLYVTPFILTTTTVVKVRAFKVGYITSNQASATFSVVTVFYANINNSYIGTDHSGTTIDPFSFNDLNSFSNSNPIDGTYNIQGIRTTNSNNDMVLNVQGNLWQGWSASINGPWRIGNTGSGNMQFTQISSDSLLKDAVIYVVNNIENISRATDVVVIAGGNVILGNASVFTACTFYGNLQ
jgi:hypothetical protein